MSQHSECIMPYEQPPMLLCEFAGGLVAALGGAEFGKVALYRRHFGLWSENKSVFALAFIQAAVGGAARAAFGGAVEVVEV